jgi:putative transposase
VLTCIVHQIRSSVRYVSTATAKRVARDLHPVYTAPNAEAAKHELDAFDDTWGERYPMIATSWHEHWEHITPFLALPEPLRRVVYTTDVSSMSR